MNDKDNFQDDLLSYLNRYLHEIQDSDGNWTGKGLLTFQRINSQ